MKINNCVIGITVLFFLLNMKSKLYSQDYSKLQANETITVQFEPYRWETASPESFGIDAMRLNAFFSKISEWENLRGLLVIKDDKLIIEKYYGGRNRLSAYNVYSITKSIISALVGIAIKEKFIKSEHEKVMDFFPEYLEKINDPRKKNITLKHLLTMSAGFNPKEWWNPSIDYALMEAPIGNDPGEHFLYYNGLPMLLSAIITKSTKLSTKKFAEKYLFEPLGIKCAYWKKNDKYYSGRSNTYFTPRDLARLGSLYLKKGQINGRQILAPSWIKKSFRNYADSDEGFFITGSSYNQTGYGYLWWISEANNITYYSAYGAGDQYLLINPKQNTIVAISQHLTETWLEKKEDVDFVSRLLTIIHKKSEE